MPRYPKSVQKIVLACFFPVALFSCKNRVSKESVINIIEQADSDTVGNVNGVFTVPELSIKASPDRASAFSFPADAEVPDHEVSPAGMTVAMIVKSKGKTDFIKFWQIGNLSVSDSFALPEGLDASFLTWHPKANALFVMGAETGKHSIYRVQKQDNSWVSENIFDSPEPLRRLIVCPRPYITGDENGKSRYSYRLFFGVEKKDKTYLVKSITEGGKKIYDVLGPSGNTEPSEDMMGYDEPAFTMKAASALPLSFHPAGHQMIWQTQDNRFMVASYDSKNWSGSAPLKAVIKSQGTLTPTPNGLGLLHWQKDMSGIGLYLHATKKEEMQAGSYLFLSEPSPVPDGRGIVGLTKTKDQYILNYVPLEMPLADVVNAWMFAPSSEEINLFRTHAGLFRPNQGEQLFKLYETENYYCNSYDRSSPTRPYLVTTDIFWELVGAAYQGLFIVKERDEAIPHFQKFVEKAYQHFKDKASPWTPVFTTLKDLQAGNRNNSEVALIQTEKNQISATSGKEYAFSDLKPRGHYTSSKEMETYFKAFRYFTTIYKDDEAVLAELNELPDELKAHAESWIKSYTGFISPSRSAMVFKTLKNRIPVYCRYPGPGLTIFPLSWGFDNEVLYSTVYHQTVPENLQVKGPGGLRMLPSGLDLAAAMGSVFAEKLLEPDFQQYPPLRKVISNLRENYSDNRNNDDFKNNLYNQWLNTLAVQWADSVSPVDGPAGIWQAKRMQTGLASWATLRHATVLVNERTAAECGEGGFEEILMRAPRGFVEPDPYTFSAIAELFESMSAYVPESTSEKPDIWEYEQEKRSLYDGILARLKESAKEARLFGAMAGKEKRGEELTNEEYQKILYVGRVAEHLFLVFNSLSNKDYALSNPDPMAKIADAAGQGPYLSVAVGNALEWDYIVPFYGRKQIVKGSVYSYFEFASENLWNDEEWRIQAAKQAFLPWIKPFITYRNASGMANTLY